MTSNPAYLAIDYLARWAAVRRRLDGRKTVVVFDDERWRSARRTHARIAAALIAATIGSAGCKPRQANAGGRWVGMDREHAACAYVEGTLYVQHCISAGVRYVCMSAGGTWQCATLGLCATLERWP